MKRFNVVAVLVSLIFAIEASQAQFGSVPLDGSKGNAPTSSASTPKVQTPSAGDYSPAPVPPPPAGAAVNVPQAPPGQGMASGTSVPQTYSPPPAPAQPAANMYTSPAPPAAAAQVPIGPDKKWVRDENGFRYVVSRDAILPQGWTEIATPQSSQPQMSAPQQMTPAYTPPNPAQGYPQPPQQAATYYQPNQQTSIADDGMKTIEDQNGYRIKVAKDSPLPPGFREVSMNQPAANPQQQPPGAGYAQQQQMQQVPTYQSQPNTYSSAPQVSNVPPTWRQQLPYQPPAPQFQNPTGPYVNQGYQPQPVP
ncbi:MAG: hypothetical protein KC964_11270, partial [Candidatus Omnitrophica bacterium]|nr:hypothetical protein [Candidatus Omnitrophota bacterium]